ncbi:hypothetical protein [Dermatobacter hominis]|uniref:hypothetical protein n=1 Tax=Dermatobacter hominis TaxID=2884263 RepID=UPI001D0FBD4A|nr:hypothetical protein [Dermatobacter hominis]UDY35877.1 hypothetical protein LH044_21480 [Dermatobacter hominis]
MAAYERLVRPWQEGWGATDQERSLPLPGDDLVEDPADQVTRAITIDADPEQVWPWLVQLGADRGGFYSYDWLENLFGLHVHTADVVVEEWQDLAVGDLVAAVRSRAGGWFVAEIRPAEALVLQVADVAAGRPVRRDDPAGWEFTWTFVLRPLPDGRTRLLVRERVAFGRSAMRLAMAPVGLVSFMMTRRMLIGVRERAERLRSEAEVAPPARRLVRADP